jgi:hypothetical protein
MAPKETHEVLKIIIAVVAALSGWAGWLALWIKYRGEATPQLTLELLGDGIFIKNHGSRTLEVINGSIVLRDPMIQPDLAKKHTFFTSVSGNVAPGKELQIATINSEFESALVDISKPFENTLELYGLSASSIGGFIAMDLNLMYTFVGSTSVKAVKFERWITGHTSRGWSLQYSPFYHRRKVSWSKKLSTWGQDFLRFALTPRASWRTRRQFRAGRNHMQVMGILTALSQRTISKTEAEKRLLKIATRSKLSVTELAKKHISPAEQIEEDNKAFFFSKNRPK